MGDPLDDADRHAKMLDGVDRRREMAERLSEDFDLDEMSEEQVDALVEDAMRAAEEERAAMRFDDLDMDW